MFLFQFPIIETFHYENKFALTENLYDYQFQRIISYRIIIILIV